MFLPLGVNDLRGQNCPIKATHLSRDRQKLDDMHDALLYPTALILAADGFIRLCAALQAEVELVRR